MKILFFARHYSYVRLFEAAITELARRGHGVHLSADREEAMGGRRMVERLAEQYPNITLGTTPRRAPDAWSEFARRLRLGIDYLRYLDSRYAVTPHLTRRARDRAPRSIVALAERTGATGSAMLGRLLRLLERGIPINRELEQYIRDQAPDVVIITPLVELGSPQMDHLATAKALGIKTVLAVASWDHLSSKALIRNVPDLIVVWNEIQKQEALEMHEVPAERVVVTGAHCYDQWFGRAPSRSRERFCSRVGLRSDRPFILYLCSSLFRGTASEPAFVERWVEAIRTSPDPRLRDIGILIRPHPARPEEWKQIDLSGFKNIAFWGDHPVDDEAKNDYFDSMYYGAAVVGLNTSAFLEAAVVGKPVHAVLDEQISKDNQEGTIHFHYLLNVNGGVLRVARTLDEHVRLLADSLAPDGGGDVRALRFVEGFIRPFGTSEPATPRFADAIETLGAAPAPRRAGDGVIEGVLRLVLYPVVGALQLLLVTQPHRKRVRLQVKKWAQDGRRRAFVALKQFAQRQLGEKELTAAPLGPPSALTPKPGRQRDPAKKLAGWNLPEAEETRELITGLGRSGRPILIGPWLSEAGFELLYWIPFLAWAKAYGNLDPSQLVVISRGGAASWYRDITTNYEDVLSFFSPDEFRVRNDARIVEQRGRLKHVEISSFDREIIAKVTEKRGLSGVRLLHPSTMYRLFDHFWFQRVPVTLIEAFTSFGPLPGVELGDLRTHLPQRYVAAKFYGNTALPDTPENHAFVASYLEELTRHVDVVLLNTGQRFDDHEDIAKVTRGRIHTIDHLMTSATNLDVQTRIISAADAYVGTYGGFSYVAPLAGTHALTFYSHITGFRFDHLEVAKRVFSGLRKGSFVELDLRSVDLLRLGFGAPHHEFVTKV
jgi:predicted glycosyltransferase